MNNKLKPNLKKKGETMRNSSNVLSIRKLMVMIVLSLLVVPSVAMSQDAANGTATATVQTVLAVTSANNLIFNIVYQGIATTMPKNNNDSSAEFQITGQGSAGINLTLSLPEYLALSDGSDRMSISFNATDVNIDSTTTTAALAAGGDGWAAVDPRNLPAATVIGSGGQTNLYLGGKVTPSVNQTAGAYTGDIVLSVAYNGN